MKRPAEVTPICLILLAAAFVGLFSYGDERGWILDFAAVVSSGIVAAVTIGFWMGNRFCHGLLMCFAAYAMVKPVILFASDPPAFDVAVLSIEAIFALPLAIWLTTPRVRAFTDEEVGI
jgi:hypothetical protein